MARFNEGDLAVIVRGPDAPTEELDESDPDLYHYLYVGSVVRICRFYDVNHENWGDQYTVEPMDHDTAWADTEAAEQHTQYVFDIHLAPLAGIDNSPTTVENYLNGTTELVGGLIKTPTTPFSNPLNGNE